MKLGEGNWTIKCQMMHAAECAASLLLIITNTSVRFVPFPKKIEASVYFLISTGCFQAMVSAIKIKPFPFVCIATRQLEPHELDNAVSFANPLMTKMWNQEVDGNSLNLWEFLNAENLFSQSFTEVLLLLFFRSLAGDRYSSTSILYQTKFGWSWATHIRFSNSCLSFPQEETWGSDDGLKS